MALFEWKECSNCHERFPGLPLNIQGHCKVCQRNPQLLTAENNMDPGRVPSVFHSLSMIEQLLIAQIHPVVSVYRLRGGKFAYSGNVINFPQDVHSFARSLPCRLSEVAGIVVVRRESTSGGVNRDFHVWADRIRAVLVYLKEHNEFYRDIIISEEIFSTLPEDSDVCEQLQYFRVTEDVNEQESDDQVSHGNVSNVTPVSQEAIDPERVSWPNIGNVPINEFNSEGYIVQAFPALFHSGRCDFKDRTRANKVSHDQYFKHLMRYADGRFAKDPRFRFFCLNSKLRWEAIRNGSLFVRNRGLAGMTAQQLREWLDERPSMSYRRRGDCLRSVLKEIMAQPYMLGKFLFRSLYYYTNWTCFA